MILLIFALVIVVIWYVTKAVSILVGSIRLPMPRLPHVNIRLPEKQAEKPDTPQRRYGRRVRKIKRLPIDEAEREALLEQAKHNLIRDAMEEIEYLE